MIIIKFPQALYKKNEELMVINVEEIVSRTDFVDCIEHLYCPELNCSAKLVYNQKTNGADYLSKLQSAEHDLNCKHYDDETKKIRNSEFYVTQNVNLSTDGITRRKGNISINSENYLNPPLEDNKKERPNDSKSKPIVKKDENSEDNQRTPVKRIVYDTNSDFDKNKAEEGVKVIEPPFYFRLLHHLSTKDANKNLETFGLIKEISLDKEKNRAEIILKLENKKVTFVLPPDFFSGGNRSTVQFQLLEFIEIIQEYVRKSQKEIYLMTMCQSQAITDNNSIILYIYDPSFMSFRLASGNNMILKNLNVLITAISTKAI